MQNTAARYVQAMPCGCTEPQAQAPPKHSQPALFCRANADSCRGWLPAALHAFLMQQSPHPLHQRVPPLLAAPARTVTCCLSNVNPRQLLLGPKRHCPSRIHASPGPPGRAGGHSAGQCRLPRAARDHALHAPHALRARWSAPTGSLPSKLQSSMQ